jgi:hypothetical protein
MFKSNDENRMAREIAREIVKEGQRHDDSTSSISDAHALGIIAAGGATIVGIVNPAIYVTAVSFIGAAMLPVGTVITAVGLIGLGVELARKKKSE